MTGKGRGRNKSEREEEARSRGFVVPTAKVEWTLPSPARHGGCKKSATAAPLALSLDGQGEGSESEDREKRCGSEWLQKDQKQNRQQKRADHAVNDDELAARRGSRFILERDNPPVKPEMKAQ